MTYTFRQDLPPDMLNLLDQSGWLKPDVGDCHWLFDVLIQSLGGNKIENIEHIKHVLAYKYLYPEAYTLPCLVIHGEGGLAKISSSTTCCGSSSTVRQPARLRPT